MLNKRLIYIILVLVLVLAWLYPIRGLSIEYEYHLKQLIPDASEYKQISNNPTVFVVQINDIDIGYIVFEEAKGYGGPLTVGIAISNEGNITNVAVINHVETPSFMKKVMDNGFLDNFPGKAVNSRFVLDYDIDNISGATITCQAIMESAKKASYNVGRTYLNKQIPEEKKNWNIGPLELIVTLIYVMAILLSLVFKKTRYRLIINSISLIIIGFYLNRPITIAYFGSSLLGYYPTAKENLLWYIILFGGIGLAVFWGKNIYCYWLCPFGCAQELLNKVSGLNIEIDSRINKKLRLTRVLLLWVGLLLIFLSRNPNISTFEPFATLFSFVGNFYLWSLLFLVIMAGLIKKRFWCQYICPTGAALDLCSQFGRYSRNTLKSLLVKDTKEKQNPSILKTVK
ncbi:MAG: FMN-binding protein [Bacillota bacterium]